MPLLIEILVAFPTVHRTIADCPRSMLDGSTVNSLTTGRPSGGVGASFGASATGGGGGGGATGAFFPQDEAINSTSKVNAQSTRTESREWNGGKIFFIIT